MPILYSCMPLRSLWTQDLYYLTQADPHPRYAKAHLHTGLPKYFMSNEVHLRDKTGKNAVPLRFP